MPQTSVLRETKILILICIMDLVFTSWLYVNSGFNPLIERNPVMRHFLVAGGLIAFGAAKMAFTLPALIALEWYRKRNPVYSTRMLRLAIGCYLAIFLGGAGMSIIQ